MKPSTLVARALRFYWRTHLGTLAGVALSSAVLVAALAVGDSVRGSLERTAIARLGGVETALDTGSRMFSADLAGRLGATAVLQVPGMAIREGAPQVNGVEVLGVGPGFFAPSPGELAVNEELAAALHAKVGDEVALRVLKPGLLSRDAPLASRKDRETRRRLFTLRAILSEARMGRFSLKSDQSAPLNAFVDLRTLQETLEMEGRANLMVSRTPVSLAGVWKPEDADLRVQTLGGVLQLQSSRIYLDPAVASKALQPPAVGALMYLVDSLSSEGGRSTPYSFVTALTPSEDRTLGPVPAGMKDDEILVNRRVAEHLAVKKGDRVKIAWSELTAGDTFVKRERSFAVRGILEMEALAAERALVPEFPGLTDVEKCEDWDVGLPMEKEKLKDAENEKYWKEHKQTPKAFVTLAAGRAMWANRFGDLMAVRLPASSTFARIDPADAGFVFRPVREEAMRAAAESTDLGGLFLGMSMFLIAASLALTAMLFVFSMEQRAREMGILLAVGHAPSGVKRLMMAEGAVLAALGALAGIPFGWGFAALLIDGLQHAWSGAIAGASVSFRAGMMSALTGAVAAAAISAGAMGLVLRRLAGRPARRLISEDPSLEAGEGRVSIRGWVILEIVFALLLLILLGSGSLALKFFGLGLFLLQTGIGVFRLRLSRLSAASSEVLSVAKLGVRNAARRPGRSLAVAGMLASGCFVVLSVSAMETDPARDAGERGSGTGGFKLYGQSSVAIHGKFEGDSIVALKLREGDDASCLNLNQSLAPSLLGVDPARLAGLGAFAGPELWGLLDGASAGGPVPALVGDSATATWKLKKGVGDLLDYTDERGRPFQVKLVGELPHRVSVLQGRLLISREHFTRLFPSESGHRVFLVDAPAALAGRLEGSGLSLVPSFERLRQFYVVESTYLSMFLVLGGLGLLLGTAGMGVLVLRTVMERRGELALLRAVGYSAAQAGRVVAAEHRFLLLAGLLIGTLSAAVAILPAAGGRLPWALFAGFLLGMAVLSMGWIWAATKLALRAALIPALRNE